MRLGKNTILSKNIRVRYPDTFEIGDGCIIDDFVYVSCALKMGQYSHISANCTLLGNNVPVTIGSFVDIAPGCCIVSASQDYVEGGLSSPCISKEFQCGPVNNSPVSFADFILLGSHSIVLPGTQLPVGLATGAFTLLIDQEYEPWTLYVGIPARPLKSRKVISADNFIRSIR